MKGGDSTSFGRAENPGAGGGSAVTSRPARDSLPEIFQSIAARCSPWRGD
jgi:hypothetical protein